MAFREVAVRLRYIHGACARAMLLALYRVSPLCPPVLVRLCMVSRDERMTSRRFTRWPERHGTGILVSGIARGPPRSLPCARCVRPLARGISEDDDGPRHRPLPELGLCRDARPSRGARRHGRPSPHATSRWYPHGQRRAATSMAPCAAVTALVDNPSPLPARQLAHRSRSSGWVPWGTDGRGPGRRDAKESAMPRGPHRRTPPQERHAFGLTILHPSHPEVRRLQQDAVQPTLHGHKVWPTSFVLLDYLSQRGVPPQTHVLELGCGWGLVGIACAKLFQAQVTGLDADAAVFPYLQLHAQRNGVHITTRHGTFADIAPQDLAAFDLIVGADICFWEELVEPLYELVRQGVAAGVAE